VIDTQLYKGQGVARPNAQHELPVVDPEALQDPADYRATPKLAAAVEVALMLGMPLLLTGEPGSGKSSVAASIAHELGLGEPLRFVVKSDTQARDLFYRFDTVGRFHASSTAGADARPQRFIRFEALGKAILHARPPGYSQALGLADAARHPGEARRSVVLIDEIDKAPRDVPNDVLVELENMHFDVPELDDEDKRGVTIDLKDDRGKTDNRYRPIVIITSNSEKALPEPFLRRCVFHNLELPPFKGEERAEGGGLTVEDIVAARLGKRYAANGQPLVTDALRLFRFLRQPDRQLEYKPSLAECLNWLDALLKRQEGGAGGGWPKSLAELDAGWLHGSVANLLLKKPRDQRRTAELIRQWGEAPRPQTGGK